MEAAVEKVLAAFCERPRMCVHEMMCMTGLDNYSIRYALTMLLRDKQVKRDTRVRGDSVYFRIGEAHVPLNLGLDKQHLPALFGLDEREARNRISMVKRMRDRLVIDYHPMLDLVIGDYERGLKNVEAIRYGVED